MTAVVRWAFWNTVYFFRIRRERVEWHSWWRMMRRCRKPWAEFSPHVFRNDAGKQWEVYLSDERPVYSNETLKCSVGRSRETGEILAVTIYDGA